MRRTAVSLAALLAAGCASNPAPSAPVTPLAAPAVVAGAEPVVPAPPVQPVEAAPAAPVASPVEVRPVAPVAAEAGSLDAYLKALSDVSCPAGVKKTAPEKIAVSAKPVPLQTFNPGRRKIGQLTFVAGFHLTSPDKRFGGLSGLDLLDDGNLLAVSDAGDLVWIDLAKDGVTPVSGRIAGMQYPRGQPLNGKAGVDAEGLAVNGGVALVSFEGNHRVLAFDVGRCGAAARGAPIVSGGFGRPLSEAFRAANINVGDNEGSEPLAVTRDWMLFTGLETLAGKSGPLSARPIEAAPDFSLRIETNVPEFVGLDVIEDGDEVRAFSLHRSFSPLDGNAITLSETDFRRELDQANLPRRVISEIEERSHTRFAKTATRRLAEMNVLLTIDNFEGVAAKKMDDGRVRLFVISDDNFKSGQRTLLFVFDLAK